MCPDENSLLRFARGEAGGEMVAIETHLDGCETCRKALAAAASETTLPGMAARHQLTPGQRVGRYEIERELGRGGMGIVYQARDVTLDRRVALKLLHARSDEGAQARLLREAQVMAKLAHPNVVPVFELGEWNREVYLVMELVSGVTLEAWLKREKHRTREILEKFIAAGRGLAAAHAAGVVHRDFKPANVLVGGDERVRVTDFGLSRPGPALELPATDSAVVTRDGAVVGTLAYMAPEQLDGKVADERSDQFAFCVALAEALAGVRPFEGETWAQLSQRLMSAPKLAGVPRRFRPVLLRGLAKDPARRFASMTALLNALERSQRLGWGAVAGTGVAAAAAVAILSIGPATLLRPFQRPHDVPTAAEEKWVPVVMAAHDMTEGTIVTFDDLVQKSMPERLVTTSIVKPDLASYIIGQKLTVAVQTGDALLWSQFETTRAARAYVLSATHDLAKGAELTADSLMPVAFPESQLTGEQVPPGSLGDVLGRPLKQVLHKGDTLRWDEVVLGLSRDAIQAEIHKHLPELQGCMEAAVASEAAALHGDLEAAFDIAPTGAVSAADIAVDTTGSPSLGACIKERLSGWKFPRPSDGKTVHVTYPFRLNSN